MVSQAAKGGSKSKKSNIFSKGAEIRKCNDLRARICSYCKKESMTQAQLAEKMGVSARQMTSFSTGDALTGSEVYTQGMKYLKVKMPLTQCSDEDRAEAVNNKWKITFNE
jgi:ribosome-binding protein aMBF1 (putative translation factor)